MRTAFREAHVPSMPIARVLLRSHLTIAATYLFAYVLLDWISYVHPFAASGITPWNPQAGLSFALVLLFGYHTSTAGSLPAAGPSSGVSPLTATSGNTAGGGTSGGGAAGGDAGGDTAGTRTVTGPAVPTEWGPVQVQLTLTGDRGSVTLPAVINKELPDDVVWLPANSTGNGVLADLASPGSTVSVKGAGA